MSVAYAGQEVALLSKIQRVASRIGIKPELKDDLVHEAWIKSKEYAQKIGRPLDRLSFFEIKLRCLEARRKILPDAREITTKEVDAIADVPDTHDVVADIIAREDVRKQRADAETVAWILREHPTLKLTATQADLWRIHCGCPTDRWRARRARELGVTRQNVSNIMRVVRKKVDAAVDLTSLWEGNVQPFFEKYGHHWNAPGIKKTIWNVVMPYSGVTVPDAMRLLFKPLVEPMVAHAGRLLAAEKRTLDEKHGDPQKLSQGYFLAKTAAYIDSSSEKIFALPGETWMLHRFSEMANCLTEPRNMEAHREYLCERFYAHDVEGRRLASYSLAYARGAQPEDTARFLSSNGTVSFTSYNYGPVIAHTYRNLRNRLFQTSPHWSDINLLHPLLMFTYYPPNFSTWSPQSVQSLKTICQHSLTSSHPFVVKRALRLLAELATA